MTIHHLPTKSEPWYAIVVHVCDPDGKPLCRFTDKPHGKWPEGHVWVTAARARGRVDEDVSRGSRTPGLCDTCMIRVTADMVTAAVKDEKRKHARGTKP